MGNKWWSDNPPIPPRDYWPTLEWREASPEAHGLTADGLQRADAEINAAFPNVYSLRSVRHGHLIFERYYRGQRADDANNIKSITKGITSALVGIALEHGWLSDLDQSLPEFFPEHYGSDIDPRKRIASCQVVGKPPWLRTPVRRVRASIARWLVVFTGSAGC